MKFPRAVKAASLVEYGLLVGLVSVLAISSVAGLGGRVTGIFQDTAGAISGETGIAPPAPGVPGEGDPGAPDLPVLITLAAAPGGAAIPATVGQPFAYDFAALASVEGGPAASPAGISDLSWSLGAGAALPAGVALDGHGHRRRHARGGGHCEL